MGLLILAASLPQYADDVRQNILSIFSSNSLSLELSELYGIALTAGYTLQNEKLLNAIRTDAILHVEPIHAEASKKAVAIMSMTNTFHKFKETIGNHEMKSNFKLDGLSNHGISSESFAIYSTTVSILNGCKYCINIHSKEILKSGRDESIIFSIVKIISVLKATKDVLGIESMRSYEFAAREEFM